MRRRVRFSIAGLMFTVLLASLAFAAIRAQSYICDGIVLLLSRAVLVLAVVGALCTKGAERVWWLGFAVFGLCYLGLAGFESPGNYFNITYSGVIVFDWKWGLLAPVETLKALKGQDVDSGPGSLQYFEYLSVAKSLWALLIAALGGGLAVFFFGSSATAAQQTLAPTPAPSRPRCGRSLLLAGLVVLGAAAILVTAALTMPGGTWPGVVSLLTWMFLGSLLLGALCGAGRARTVCLGGALFGSAYLILIYSQPANPWSGAVVTTNSFLDSFRLLFPPRFRGYPAEFSKIAVSNNRIREALNKIAPMHFPKETTLDDFLKAIKEATRSAEGRDLPIHVDPIGLQEAEKTMDSPLKIDLDDVPIATSLRLALSQLGMTYEIEGGVLKITSETHYGEDDYHNAFEDPFLHVGQHLLGVIAAAIGGLLGALLARPRGVFGAPRADESDGKATFLRTGREPGGG